MSLRLRTPGAGGRGWTILVGENGVGKSTVLQSIVLAALDPRPVTSLVPDAWTFVRNNEGERSTAEIALEAEKGASAARRISGERDAYVEGDTSDLGLPLLLGFSARRRIAHPGELPASENLEVERVRGLFATDHPLLTQDPFTAFKSNQAARRFAGRVRSVLLQGLAGTTGARLFPLLDQLELRGNGGITRNQQLMEQRRFVLRYGSDYVVRVGIEDLSDGYQAMLAIVLETLYQAALSTGEVPEPESMQAVILIDEIEAHLHPAWQRTVVPLLRQIFPHCQFVVTTHSPLVVGSAEAGEVVVLEVGEDGAITSTILEERLSMLGAERIYEEVFGVTRTAPPQLIEAERDYLRRRMNGSATTRELDDAVKAAWADAQRRAQM